MFDLKKLAEFFNGKPRPVEDVDRVFGKVRDAAGSIRKYESVDPLYSSVELNVQAHDKNTITPFLATLNPSGGGIPLSDLVDVFGTPHTPPISPEETAHTVVFYFPSKAAATAVIGAKLDGPADKKGTRAVVITIRPE